MTGQSPGVVFIGIIGIQAVVMILPVCLKGGSQHDDFLGCETASFCLRLNRGVPSVPDLLHGATLKRTEIGHHFLHGGFIIVAVHVFGRKTADAYSAATADKEQNDKQKASDRYDSLHDDLLYSHNNLRLLYCSLDYTISVQTIPQEFFFISLLTELHPERSKAPKNVKQG